MARKFLPRIKTEDGTKPQSSSPLSSTSDRQSREFFVVGVGRKQYEFPKESEGHVLELLASAEASFGSVPRLKLQSSQPKIVSRSQQRPQSDQYNSSLSSQGSVDSVPTPTMMRQPFHLQVRLGNDDEMIRGYQYTFNLIQQGPMKLLLKAWIKEVEPQKQRKFPYCNDNRPAWWPESERCRFKEPDHLIKPECIWVATYIFWHMVGNPNGAALSRLQEKTFRLDLALETDREGKYQKRMRYLNQLFYNANRHQKCKSGIVEEDEEVIFSFDETPVSIEWLELEAKKKDSKKSGTKESPNLEEPGADDGQKTVAPPSECQKRVVRVTSKKDKVKLAGIDEFVLIPASPKKKRAASEEPEHSEVTVDKKRRKITTTVSKPTEPPTPLPQLNRLPLDPFIYTQPWLDGFTSSSWLALNRQRLLSSLPTSPPTMLENSNALTQHTPPLQSNLPTFSSTKISHSAQNWPTSSPGPSAAFSQPFDPSYLSIATSNSCPLEEFIETEFISTSGPPGGFQSPAIVEFQPWTPSIKDA